MLFYSPSASLTQTIIEQHLLAQNKLSLFHFMATVSQAPAMHLHEQSGSIFVHKLL